MIYRLVVRRSQQSSGLVPQHGTHSKPLCPKSFFSSACFELCLWQRHPASTPMCQQNRSHSFHTEFLNEGNLVSKQQKNGDALENGKAQKDAATQADRNRGGAGTVWSYTGSLQWHPRGFFSSSFFLFFALFLNSSFGRNFPHRGLTSVPWLQFCRCNWLESPLLPLQGCWRN